MKTYLLVLGFLLSGCVTTVHLQSIADIHTKIDGRSGVIRLRGASTGIDADDLAVDADSTSYFDRAIGRRVLVATADVTQVDIVQRGGGAFEGMVLGTCGGAAVGLAIGAACRRPNAHPDFAGLAGLMIGGAVGCVSGVTLGVIRGHRFVYTTAVDDEAAP
jgi:hypothetical protein